MQLVIRTGHCLWMDDHRVKKWAEGSPKWGPGQKIDLCPRLGTWGGHKMKHDLSTLSRLFYVSFVDT